MIDKHYDEKIKVVPSRLRQVLEEEFCGNMLLMAYCCGVDKITLKAWLNGKRLPNKLGMMPYIICVSPSWLRGDSDSREVSDPSLFAGVSKRYDEMYTLYDKEEWLKRELVKVNALQKKERERIKKEADFVRDNGIMNDLLDAADRLGYDKGIATTAYNVVVRYEMSNGKLTDTPRELWKAIRGCGVKTLALLYEAFPEK